MMAFIIVVHPHQNLQLNHPTLVLAMLSIASSALAFNAPMTSFAGATRAAVSMQLEPFQGHHEGIETRPPTSQTLAREAFCCLCARMAIHLSSG